ncbi:MAG: M16 family metallopeptidase [Gemmatimonadota bacterium]
MQADITSGVHSYALDGGARATIKRKSNIPLVTIALAARGGVHDESPSNAGLTGLMARTSLKGTQRRTAAQIAQLAEAMGGSISPSVSADLIDWEITVPARHFEQALELLADVAFDASFPAPEFAVERKLALADVQHSRDDMYRYPLRLAMQQAFRGHAYGNTIGAVERSLTHATPAEAGAWHAARVRSQPWAFVVGDVDPGTTARAIAGVLPRSEGATGRRHGTALQGGVKPQRVQWQGGTRDVEFREKAQTALALAFPGPAHEHPDSYTLQVLANAVGGLGGRLFEELRSKRSLAYTVSLMPIARWLGGAFVAYIATSPEREEEARGALLEQFDRLATEPLPVEEVTRAQRYTIGTWQIRSQTNAAQLAELMHACMLGEGIAEMVEFERRIRAVTPASIQNAAQTWFEPARAVEGIVRGKERQ